MAEQRDELAPPNREVDVPQGVEGPEDPADAVEPERFLQGDLFADPVA